MKLSLELRNKIADNLIRVVAPVLFFGMLLAAVAILLVAGGQYQRLMPTTFVILLTIPAWIYNQKGKSLVGVRYLIASLCIGMISGMVVSGGVHAISYTSGLILITIFVVLYGTRGGLAFVAFTLLSGCLFTILIRQDILHRVDDPGALFLFLIHAILLVMQFLFVLVPVRLMFKALKDSQRHSKKLQQAMVEKKQVQDELESILNQTPDIIYRTDTEGRITFINDTARKYGYNPEKILGTSIIDLIHPNDRLDAQGRIQERRTKQRTSHDTEVRFSLPHSENKATTELKSSEDGLAFLITSKGLYSGDTFSPNTYLGSQGIARDISKLKYFENQANRLAAIVEQAPEDVIITDKNAIIQYINPKFEEVTGYLFSEVVGKTPRIFQSGKQDTAFYKNLWDTITNGKTWRGHIWNKIKNGSLILQDVTITPIFDSKQNLTGYASVRRDITEQTRTQEQLQHAQKMEAIGTLAGGIAHDFNNILSGVIGYTELALIEVKKQPSTAKKLERVLDAGGRATELVKQILSFSRSQKSEVKLVSPLSITKEVLKLIRASLPSTITIQESLLSESFIQADATNIHQILMNLCTNAAHAMRQEGGTLSVHLQDVSLETHDLSHHPDVLPGDFLKISITDTGIGMTKKIQAKAFDPFFTTKALGEGTGMGLATVHGFVAELGGFISLYSETDQGTAVHIFIPTISNAVAVNDAHFDSPLPGGTERILLVDDEQLQIDLAKDMLTKYGYQVETFSDSLVALNHFQQHHDEYDLVVTDMTMPKMTGDKFAKKVRLKHPEIPIIMCTGFSETIDGSKAKALGIDAFLYKPIVMATLLETIREVLD